MAKSVLDNVYRMVNGRRGCGITSTVTDKKTGRKIGFRATMQMDYGDAVKAVITGFSYLPDRPETIGVMEKIAKVGAGEDRLIIVYFDDRPFHQSLVFNPQAFLEHGLSEAKQEERKARGERWLNLDRDLAVSLWDFAEGSDEPKVEPTKRENIERDGGWFSV